MSVSFSFQNRAEHMGALQKEPLDLLIVGGGITGAGVLREAALNGLKVGLVEKNDFAFGTSSRSSKLAHGGLRYLENLEFGLVGEALRERHHLIKMAPHMVEPLRFLIPIYKGDRVGWLKMKLGMVFYDLLSWFHSPGRHRSISKSEILKNYPGIKAEGLKGGFLYYDANMEDDRLVLETLKSGVEKGGLAASYLKAVSFEKQDGMCVVSCKDQLDQKSFTVKAKHVISCVGPWTDSMGEMVSGENWQEKMRPSKGVHVTFPKEVLNLNTAMVMAADKESRILFCIPRDKFDIVGTTDTDYRNSLNEVYATQEDVDYILNVLKDYYPKHVDLKSKVLSAYAGVRPLVKDGSSSESKVSRTHWIHTDPKNNVTYISGGKYTTYMAMAHEVLDEVSKVTDFKIKSLKHMRAPFAAESHSSACPEGWVEQEHKEFSKRHGGHTKIFLEKHQAPTLFETELKVALHEYACGSLTDFYFRRVPYVLQGRYLEESYQLQAAQVFQTQLQLSSEQMQVQIQDLNKELQAVRGCVDSGALKV